MAKSRYDGIVYTIRGQVQVCATDSAGGTVGDGGDPHLHRPPAQLQELSSLGGAFQRHVHYHHYRQDTRQIGCPAVPKLTYRQRSGSQAPNIATDTDMAIDLVAVAHEALSGTALMAR